MPKRLRTVKGSKWEVVELLRCTCPYCKHNFEMESYSGCFSIGDTIYCPKCKQGMLLGVK